MWYAALWWKITLLVDAKFGRTHISAKLLIVWPYSITFFCAEPREHIRRKHRFGSFAAILACKWGVWLMFIFFQLGILRAGIMFLVSLHSISHSDLFKVHKTDKKHMKSEHLIKALCNKSIRKQLFVAIDDFLRFIGCRYLRRRAETRLLWYFGTCRHRNGSAGTAWKCFFSTH